VHADPGLFCIALPAYSQAANPKASGTLRPYGIEDQSFGVAAYHVCQPRTSADEQLRSSRAHTLDDVIHFTQSVEVQIFRPWQQHRNVLMLLLQ
jgi:hypothetical protein